MEDTERPIEFIVENPSSKDNVQSVPLYPILDEDKFECLILSEAGKPIYSYTKRDDVATLMPLCSALLDYAQKTQKETLHSIRTVDNLIINFSKRPPLIIIVIHDINSFIDPQTLVDQVEAQIISILTAKTLRSVFEERPTYDLKKPLYGSEKLIDAIIRLTAFTRILRWPWIESFLTFPSHRFNLSTTNYSTNQSMNSQPTSHPYTILIPLAVMPPSARDNIHSIVNNAVTTNSKNMVFSLLFRVGADSDQEVKSKNSESGDEYRSVDDSSTSSHTSETNEYRLITICNHHDRHKLKVSDVHIVLALLSGSKAQIHSAESLWMPICLPKFNQDAFLHSYISYINESRHCLIMMSIDRDDFNNCQASRDIIEEKISSLLREKSQKSRLYYTISPLVHPILLELQDRLTSIDLSATQRAEIQHQTQIYNSKAELYQARQLQFFWYQTSRQVLWWQRSDRHPPNSVIYYMTKKMAESSFKHLWLKSDRSVFLGWNVPSFQLFAQFDGSTSTNEATEAVQRITNWIKKEEDNLSMKDYR